MIRPLNYWSSTILVGILWGIGAGIVIPQGTSWWKAWIVFAVALLSFFLGLFTRR